MKNESAAMKNANDMRHRWRASLRAPRSGPDRMTRRSPNRHRKPGRAHCEHRVDEDGTGSPVERCAFGGVKRDEPGDESRAACNNVCRQYHFHRPVLGWVCSGRYGITKFLVSRRSIFYWGTGETDCSDARNDLVIGFSRISPTRRRTQCSAFSTSTPSPPCFAS